MRASGILVSWAAVVATTAIAAGQPIGKPAPGTRAGKPPALVGLTQTGAHVPDRGFLDDVVATDGARLAVIVTDGDDLIEARVLGPDGAPQATVTLGAIAPAVRRMYLLGERLFVVADADEGPVGGALIGLDAKVIKKHAPATDLFVRKVDGKDAVIVYTRTPGKAGVVNRVQAVDPVKARPVARRAGQLTIGADGRDARLDFRPVYFLDDQTVAVGQKGGAWKKSADLRSPDSAARYDLLTGKWLRDEPIVDLIGHGRRLEVLATAADPQVFVRMKDDRSELELWRDGTPTALRLDQPLAVYDAASVAYAMRGDRVWLSLRVDPVNPPAVARKKADPEYLDLFEISGNTAVRRARILAPKRKLRWGFAGDVLWVMEKNVGFDRGSKSVVLYRLD